MKSRISPLSHGSMAGFNMFPFKANRFIQTFCLAYPYEKREYYISTAASRGGKKLHTGIIRKK